MAVYIDNAHLPFGRMVMSHMIADTPAELLAMIDRLGISRRWIQQAGTAREHFDLCASKRKLALAFGVIEITDRELVEKLQKRGGSASAQLQLIEEPGGGSL